MPETYRTLSSEIEEARRYVGQCVRMVRCPDKTALSASLGIEGIELERWINEAICLYVVSDHRSTGTFAQRTDGMRAIGAVNVCKGIKRKQYTRRVQTA